MKEVKMFIMSGCPHCRKAHEMVAEIFAEHPEYAAIPFTVIDENKRPDVAEKYDYYYVPTFYTGDEKTMEGVPTKEAVKNAFAKALE